MMSRFFIFVIIVGAFTGCYKDVDNTTTKNYPEPPTTIINSKLVGSVEDSAENLIEKYTLLVAGESSLVDSKYYTLSLNQISKYDQTIWVTQNDEVISMAHRPIQENDINEISFKTFSTWTKKLIDQNQELAFTTGALLSIDFSKYTATSTC